MQRGLKVEGGDRLGKTIIFARNHKHAEEIIKRFNANYGHYNGKFARIIDSHDDKAQTTLVVQGVSLGAIKFKQPKPSPDTSIERASP